MLTQFDDIIEERILLSEILSKISEIASEILFNCSTVDSISISFRPFLILSFIGSLDTSYKIDNNLINIH